MTRLSLRALSATEAESLSMIAQRANGIALPALSENGTPEQAAAEPNFSIHPLAVAPLEILSEDSLVIHLQWSGAQFLLVLSTANVVVVLRRLVSQAPFENIAPAWQAGLDHLLTQWFCTQIERLGRGRPDVLASERLRAGATIPKLTHAFSVRADTEGAGTANVFLDLHSDSLGVHLLSGLCSSRDFPEQASGLTQALPQVMRLTVGKTRLSVHALRALKAGHLVFIEDSRLISDHLLWCGLRTHNGRELGFLARYENLSITLLRGPMENTNLISDEGMPAETGQDESDPIEPIAIQDLPFTLSFDCGSVTLSLAQIEQLAEGQVIPTARALNDYVTIRANGAVIGRGVLMQVDGRLAVNITGLSTASGKSADRPL
jgi:type III secretion system YscQ/HrcQ family protein